MKKLFFLFFTVLFVCSDGFGQKNASPKTIPDSITLTIKGEETTFAKADLQLFVENASQEIASLAADSTAVPDTLCLSFEDSVLCLPTRDGKEAFDIVKVFFERNKGNWPKNAIGWIGLFIAFVLSAPGVALISKSKSIYKFLSMFLRKTLNVVLFVAMLLTGLVTYISGLLGNGGFDWSMFLTIWGFMSFAAVWAYHRWFEKKEDIAARLAAKKK